MRRKISILLTLCMVFSLLTNVVFAQNAYDDISDYGQKDIIEYYISDDGDDSYEGSEAKPFRTIQKAMAKTTDDSLRNYVIHVQSDITYEGEPYDFDKVTANILIIGDPENRPTITLKDSLPDYFMKKEGSLYFQNVIINCNEVSGSNIIHYLLTDEISPSNGPSLKIINSEITSTGDTTRNKAILVDKDKTLTPDSEHRSVHTTIDNSEVNGTIWVGSILTLINKVVADHLAIHEETWNGTGLYFVDYNEPLSEDSEIKCDITLAQKYDQDKITILQATSKTLKECMKNLASIKFNNEVYDKEGNLYEPYYVEKSYSDDIDHISAEYTLTTNIQCDFDSLNYKMENYHFIINYIDEIPDLNSDIEGIEGQYYLPLTESYLKNGIDLSFDISEGASVTYNGKPVWSTTTIGSTSSQEVLHHFDFSDKKSKDFVVTSQNGKHSKTYRFTPILLEPKGTYKIIYMDHTGKDITNTLPAIYNDYKTHNYYERNNFNNILDIPRDDPYEYPGYDFTGWFTKDNTDTHFLHSPEDYILYARWEVDPYSGSSSGGSSSGGSSSGGSSSGGSSSSNKTPSTSNASSVQLKDLSISVSDKGALKVDGVDADYTLTSLPEKNNDPIEVNFDLTKVEVKNADHLTLIKKVTLDDGTVKEIRLGGTFDPNTKNFSAYIDGEGEYLIKEVEDIKKIYLQINNPTIKVNGTSTNSEVLPQIINNTTVVPLRMIAETLGADVKWNNATKQAIITLDGKTITVGNAEGAVLINNRTLVPMRYISESFGARVVWIPSSKSIEIVK